jgi:hypothetical protein
MSVERIAPLGQTTTDAPTMRPVTAPAFDPGRAPRAAFPLATPMDGQSHLFDSLVLPLPEMAQDTPSAAQIRALYREEAASGAMIAMVDGRLPVTALRNAVESLLFDLAGSSGVSAADLIAQAEKTAPGHLPSRNGEKAHFNFRARLAAFDANGRLRLLDLYLARIGVRQWEAAAYDRTPARAANLFPRPTPLVDLHRLVIDPDSGSVRACIPWETTRAAPVAQQLAPGGGAIYARAGAAIVGVAALLSLFVRGPSWATSGLLVVTLVVALAAG